MNFYEDQRQFHLAENFARIQSELTFEEAYDCYPDPIQGEYTDEDLADFVSDDCDLPF
jgi:hypothetical protein